MLYCAAMKPLVTTSASGSPENSFVVFPLDGSSLIEQKNDSTTTLPERTADTFPPPIETCVVKESCVGDTEYYAQRYDAESTMLPLSLLFLAVAITDPSGSKTTAPTALSLTSTPRNLCAGLKPSGIVAICIELHAGISLLRVIGSLTHRDTMPLVFTPYILSCDEMFIIDAVNEAWDTESLRP